MNERQVGGLWCHEVLECLDAFVAGTLSPEMLPAVEAHVADCIECARFGAAYTRLVHALRKGPEEALGEARLLRLGKAMAGVE